MNHRDLNNAYLSISKDDLGKLPIADYSGNIILVDTPEKLDKAIEDLNSHQIIGFDTETRPSFRKGQSYNVALIQLATKDCCYLFRTNELGYPKSLIDLLENPSIMKVGLSIHDDFHNLRKITDVNPQGFIDLQTFVKDYKIADNSLSKIYAVVFGERVSKGQRLSNWEANELTEAQQHYAALDAFACLNIYNFLKDGKFNPLHSPHLTFPSETEEKSTDIDYSQQD